MQSSIVWLTKTSPVLLPGYSIQVTQQLAGPPVDLAGIVCGFYDHT